MGGSFPVTKCHIPGSENYETPTFPYYHALLS